MVISQDLVEKHIKSLNKNKALDAYGVTAEHIRPIVSEIATPLPDIFNNIIDDVNAKVEVRANPPDELKVGYKVSILKKRARTHYIRITTEESQLHRLWAKFWNMQHSNSTAVKGSTIHTTYNLDSPRKMA